MHVDHGQACGCGERGQRAAICDRVERVGRRRDLVEIGRLRLRDLVSAVENNSADADLCFDDDDVVGCRVAADVNN